jgi:hypothetical protein
MMQMQQCNVQQFNYDKQSLFLGQLGLVPKIGQRGQLESKEVDYTRLTMITKITIRYKLDTR